MPPLGSPRGVTFGLDGGTIRVASANATSIDLIIYDQNDLDWELRRVPLDRGEDAVWVGASSALTEGTPYALRVSGPEGAQHGFVPSKALLDPYARGIVPTPEGEIRGIALGPTVKDPDAPTSADDFSWQGIEKPRTPLSETVIYEAHLRGFSKLNPDVPEELRGTYAGLGHEASIRYLKDLGVTAVELLPVHAFLSEQRLVRQGRVNYWGYNTLNFFTPHAPYASKAARLAGASAVRREFAEMVRSLHAAGLEVILDVVYNHTAEEGRGGPVLSFRGIDNAMYYRQDASGAYIDTTGCGNTLDTSQAAVQELILDSMRYFAEELGVDGFRLDLAVSLGRDAEVTYTPNHPLLEAMVSDPILSKGKLIAEPWDVSLGGWQTGNFHPGFSEWNDRYRDKVRQFWLSDLRQERETGTPSEGIGSFATELAGSSNTFSAERGPIASVNFVTAHDGFTMADLASYDVKHNLGNGEENRDGTDSNGSYNHGVEGDTDDVEVLASRRRSVRNMLGTLLLSAGVPMLTAGDEFGRTQRGNNNAYCQDSELTWLSWTHSERDTNLLSTTKMLIRARRENISLRPKHFGVLGEHSNPMECQMDWFDNTGDSMSVDDWNNANERTLQYLASAEPTALGVAPSRTLLIVHGHDGDTKVTLPTVDGITSFELIWNSANETPGTPVRFTPGQELKVSAQSMQLFRAE